VKEMRLWPGSLLGLTDLMAHIGARILRDEERTPNQIMERLLDKMPSRTMQTRKTVKTRHE
jgi:hypothetical protein